MEVKLNLGCRDDILPGYQNIDLYHEAPGIDKYDIRELPHAKGSVDEIVAHSILEHFNYDEGKKALKHWCSLLKRGGKISIYTPDFEKVLELVGRRGVESAAGTLYGRSDEPGQEHRSCWWRQGLKEELEACGMKITKEGSWMDDIDMEAEKL